MKTKKRLNLGKETLVLLADMNIGEMVGASPGSRSLNCPTNESCTGLCICHQLPPTTGD